MAPVVPGRENELRRLLSSMNLSSGAVDPKNGLVPFARFDRLHFARLVVLSDPTASDIAVYGVPAPVFIADIGFFRRLRRVGRRVPGRARRPCGARSATDLCILRGLFTGCRPARVDAASRQSPVAAYVNTIGRTVRQIREEAALHHALAAYASAPARAVAIRDPRELHHELVSYVGAQQRAGSLTLSEPEPTPIGGG